MALVGSQVVATARDTLFIIDAATGQVAPIGRSLSDFPLSSPSVAPQGHILFSTVNGIVATTPAGQRLWVVPVDRPLGKNEFPALIALRAPVVDPAGNAYVATPDGQVRAVSATGAVLWSIAAGSRTPVTDFDYPEVIAGAADLVIIRDGLEGAVFVDRSSGRAMATPKIGRARVSLFPPYAVLTRQHGIVSGPVAFDACGAFRWQLPATSEARVISLTSVDDHLLEIHGPANLWGMPNGDSNVALWDAQGAKVRDGFGVAGQPVAVGADGSVYAVWCPPDDGTTRPPTVSAYDGQTFARVWQLELPGACPSGNVVLTNDGLLYVHHVNPAGVDEVYAIQTASPGLANSSWPSLRADNAATSWLQ